MLGFPVLGVWPDGSDGSDINAAHRSNDGKPSPNPSPSPSPNHNPNPNPHPEPNPNQDGSCLLRTTSEASSSSTRRAPHASPSYHPCRSGLANPNPNPTLTPTLTPTPTLTLTPGPNPNPHQVEMTRRLLRVELDRLGVSNKCSLAYQGRFGPPRVL